MNDRGPASTDSPHGPRPSGRAETALLRAVLHILFAVWGLGVREAAPILGGVPLRTLFHWRERPDAARVDPALRHRLAAILALHKALRRLHPDAAAQREWLRAPDEDGRTPVAVLMAGRGSELRGLRDRARRLADNGQGPTGAPD